MGIFGDNTAKFPKLLKNINDESRIKKKKSTPRHVVVKLQITEDGETPPPPQRKQAGGPQGLRAGLAAEFPVAANCLPEVKRK